MPTTLQRPASPRNLPSVSHASSSAGRTSFFVNHITSSLPNLPLSNSSPQHSPLQKTTLAPAKPPTPSVATSSPPITPPADGPPLVPIPYLAPRDATIDSAESRRGSSSSTGFDSLAMKASFLARSLSQRRCWLQRNRDPAGRRKSEGEAEI